jgi:hypothetical protein
MGWQMAELAQGNFRRKTPWGLRRRRGLLCGRKIEMEVSCAVELEGCGTVDGAH